MYKHSTNVHKEKERMPLIDCFDFFPKSAEKSKKFPIELNKFIIGGPLFSNHPVELAFTVILKVCFKKFLFSLFPFLKGTIHLPISFFGSIPCMVIDSLPFNSNICKIVFNRKTNNYWNINAGKYQCSKHIVVERVDTHHLRWV